MDSYSAEQYRFLNAQRQMESIQPIQQVSKEIGLYPTWASSVRAVISRMIPPVHILVLLKRNQYRLQCSSLTNLLCPSKANVP
jgi:hypothetical protein